MRPLHVPLPSAGSRPAGRVVRRLAVPTLVAAMLAAGAVAHAAPDLARRWDGTVDIPGEPVRLVVDLVRDARGAWTGSTILPGRGVKGAPLGGLAVTGTDVRFDLAAAFPGPPDQAPRVALALQPDGSLAGTFGLGGRTAAVTLHAVGAAQVDRPPASTPISAALAGTWTGRYELGGSPREVTLTLANRPQAQDGASGKLVIVGKRTTTLDVDLVIQGREFVTLRASAADFRIEGRLAAAAGTIEGAMSQGPFEAPIVLRRQAAAGEKTS